MPDGGRGTRLRPTEKPAIPKPSDGFKTSESRAERRGSEEPPDPAPQHLKIAPGYQIHPAVVWTGLNLKSAAAPV